MTSHRAQCACGQLSVICEGAPVRTGVCHCFDCKRNTGSAFSFGATFRAENVRVEGQTREWVRIGDEGTRGIRHFCPVCGVTVFGTREAAPELVRVEAGCFADLAFPPAPTMSTYDDDRTYPWLALTCEPLERN
jgi:hypothetical protein